MSNQIRSKLAFGLLALAAALVAGSVVAIAVSGTVGPIIAVALIIGGAAGGGALAIMVRRLNRAQAKHFEVVTQERLMLGQMVDQLNSIDHRLGDLADSIGTGQSKIEQVREDLSKAKELLGAINPGPEWPPSKWDEIDRRLTKGKFSIEQMTRRLVTEDVSALLAMHNLVAIKGEPLSATSYVAAPETLLALISLIAALPDDAVIVEAGSGLSTVWLALAVEQSGRPISIVSLENDAGYASATRAALARQRLADSVRVDVRNAPLTEVTINGEKYRWYAPHAYSDLTRVDVLFVDGPPAATGPRSRYPAVPVFERVLVDGAVVVLDDTDRKDERFILERWVAEPDPRGSLTVERQLDRATLLRYRLTPDSTDPEPEPRGS